MGFSLSPPLLQHRLRVCVVFIKQAVKDSTRSCQTRERIRKCSHKAPSARQSTFICSRRLCSRGQRETLALPTGRIQMDFLYYFQTHLIQVWCSLYIFWYENPLLHVEGWNRKSKVISYALSYWGCKPENLSFWIEEEALFSSCFIWIDVKPGWGEKTNLDCRWIHPWHKIEKSGN